MGDEERNAHLLEVGRAIAEWAEVQDELFYIVLSILRCKSEQASIVFFRTPNLESRLTLTDDLLKSIFPQPSQNPGSHPHPGFAVWTDIQKEIREEIKIRNRLAHQPVVLHVGVWEHESGEIKIEGPPFHATTISHPEHLRKRSEDAPLGTEAIKAHIVRISKFTNRLLDFRFGPLAKQLQEVG